jgi:hypothetical protein
MASTRRPRRKGGDRSAPERPALESVVIYVHGIGRQPPPTQLKLEWDLALFGRDLGERSVMAYWSDLLHGDDADDTDAPPAGRKRAAARSATALPEPPVPARLRTQARNFELALQEALGVEPPHSGGPRAKVLPLPAWLRKPIGRSFLNAFVRDTAAYFFNPTLRRRIRERLAQAIAQARGRPVTLVAHSQGSIVAYEVLSQLGERDIELDALVTIGSPLGLQGSPGPARAAARHPGGRAALAQLRRSPGRRRGGQVHRVRLPLGRPRDRGRDRHQRELAPDLGLQSAFRGGLPHEPARAPRRQRRHATGLHGPLRDRARRRRAAGRAAAGAPSRPHRSPRAGLPGAGRVRGRDASHRRRRARRHRRRREAHAGAPHRAGGRRARPDRGRSRRRLHRPAAPVRRRPPDVRRTAPRG